MKKTFCFDNCWLLSSVEIWSTSDLRFVRVISVENREPRGTFLSLGFFISQPWPMALASKMRPWLQKTFPQFLFFYFDNLDKSQIRRRQIFPQSSQHNYQNKILLPRGNHFLVNFQ